MTQTVEEIKSEFEKTQQEYNAWLLEAEEDYRFYLGRQWSEDDLDAVPDDYPALTLNIIKKPIDLMSGYQRQNRTDLKVYPIEGSDSRVCEIHTQLLKYTLSRTGYSQQYSQACMDAFICGLGFVHAYITYKYDKLNGDICVSKEDPRRIFIDPYFTKLDLSDAEFVFRTAYITKNQLKDLYPKKQTVIEDLTGERDNIVVTGEKRDYGREEDMINVIEKWYRKKIRQKYLVNLETKESEVLTEELAQKFNESTPDPQRYKILNDVQEKIFLSAIAGNQILYDGENPFEIHSMYPFIPVFGHFLPTSYELDLRIQGMVRKYKDINREKNKRRSQAMYSVLTKHMMGYIMEDDVIISEEAFTGGGKIIKVSPGALSGGKVREVPQPEFPQTQILLEEQFDKDALRIGENADLIGLSGGGASGATAPGVTLQLRQRQGLTSTQEIFDNISFAYKMLGNYHIELVNKKYSREKIESICGENLPWVKLKKELNEELKAITAQAENFLKMGKENAGSNATTGTATA